MKTRHIRKLRENIKKRLKMDVLKVELNELKRMATAVISSPKNIALGLCGLGASCFVYLTVKLYLERRKFRNIPGPPANGYNQIYLK